MNISMIKNDLLNINLINYTNLYFINLIIFMIIN